MKIVMLTGSPHKEGTTDLLASEYARGAIEIGHEVIRFDTAHMDIHPCIGCDYCRNNDGECIYKDDMKMISDELEEADVVVFVTPLYYFAMTAQLKTAIDRFYATNVALRSSPIKAYLIAAGADDDDWAMDGLKAHFTTMCRYMKWEEMGSVLALGLSDREDALRSDYLKQVRDLAQKIK
ncbi:MAG: flavodoxin family protein [Dethiosulfatibacter sp.]|nr:flavodoxin family protein [Dethiosulfatibacter sp.]